MKIRNAKIEDAKDILNWRNNIDSRKMSGNKSLINKVDHNIWFKTALENNNCFLYIGVKNNIKLGVVRFDCNFYIKESEVSINLNPKMRGKGMSFDLLRLSIEKVNQLKIVSFKATIKDSNYISKNIFEKCGFIFKYSDNGFNFFTLNNK
jgi:predicted acetyltransferase